MSRKGTKPGLRPRLASDRGGGVSIYSLFRPLAFALGAETAHRATIAGLRLAPRRKPAELPPSLRTTVAGIEFPSPVGLAAGFDKDGEVPEQMLGLGFGFVEVGTLTPKPQPGNPRPRLFRLVEDEAVINRMGFNNAGQQAALERLRGTALGASSGSTSAPTRTASTGSPITPWASAECRRWRATSRSISVRRIRRAFADSRTRER